MEERPKLKIERTSIDTLIEIAGWIFVATVWTFTTYIYSDLPSKIPTHFNAAGVADGFGGKASIFSLPVVSTVLFIGLTILNRFPHVFNYPTEITRENALKQYTIATRMIRYLKVVIVLIFGLIDYKTVQHVHGKTLGLGIWFLPLTLGLIFIPLGYFIHKSVKNQE